ncbi:hypothetical protein C8F01DRAFT_1154656 [Mycena amicta]|nr:hypothetical protein C8F01DRAFT_1154656 [Mycena amicta]
MSVEDIMRVHDISPLATSPTVPPLGPVCGTYRKDGRTFAVNCGDPTVVVETPLPAPHNPELNSEERNFTRPSYLTPVDAHLMFIPRQNPWTGPIFSFLDHTAESFPIVQFKPKNFGLCPNERRKWRTLESTLRAFCLTMATMVNLEGLILSPPVAPPREYGYASTFPSEEIARSTICRLRDDLLPLLGAVSLAFWCVRFADGSPDDIRPWQAELIQRSGLDPGWVTALEGSVVNDWNVPRVGGILDVAYEDPRNRHMFFKPSEFDSLLGSIVRATSDTNSPLNLPLYFHWGSKHHDYPFLPPFLEDIGFIPDAHLDAFMDTLPGPTRFHPWQVHDAHFFPCEEKVTLYRADCQCDIVPVAMDIDLEPDTDSAEKREQQVASATQIIEIDSDDVLDLQNLVLSPAEIPQIERLQQRSFPPIHLLATQLPYEDLEAFLQRRAEKNRCTAAAETPQDYDRRMNREHKAVATNAANLPPSDTDAAVVFMWMVQGPDGHRVRTPVLCDIDVVWNSFPSAQRIYDAFHNEWDLADAPQLDSSHTSDYVVEDANNEPAIGELQGAMHSTAAKVFSIEVKAPRSADNSVWMELVSPDTVSEPHFLEVASLRFGYVEPPPGRDGPNVRPLHAHGVSMLLGHSGRQSKEVSENRNLLQFFGQLSTARSFRSIDPLWSDFSHLASGLRSEWPFKVQTATLRSILEQTSATQFYILADKHPHHTDVDKTCLLLKSAATLLQILRQRWGPNVRDVARHLLSRGISFSLARCAKHTVGNPSDRDSNLNRNRRPVQTPGYATTETHSGRRYRIYLDHLKSNILDTARGRLALQAGGLIGRLAGLVVPTDEGLRGPDEDVFDTGDCLWDGVSPYVYWYNSLSVHEVGVVLGRCSDQKNEDVSWWPPPTVWFDSHLFPQWWTSRCEKWFVKRHNAALQGDPNWKELAVNIWKEKIKQDNEVLRLRRDYERFADGFLVLLIESQRSLTKRTLRA